jgi:hypothetical protein
MKSIVATITALFAVTAFAQTPAAPAKAEEKKPAATPAPAPSAPAKKDEKKAEPKKDEKKAEPAKK